MELPSRFQLNDDVAYRGQSGKIVKISFTESSVSYDIVLNNGMMIYNAPSNDLNTPDHILRIVRF